MGKSPLMGHLGRVATGGNMRRVSLTTARNHARSKVFGIQASSARRSIAPVKVVAMVCVPASKAE